MTTKNIFTLRRVADGYQMDIFTTLRGARCSITRNRLNPEEFLIVEYEINEVGVHPSKNPLAGV